MKTQALPLLQLKVGRAAAPVLHRYRATLSCLVLHIQFLQHSALLISARQPVNRASKAPSCWWKPDTAALSAWNAGIEVAHHPSCRYSMLCHTALHQILTTLPQLPVEAVYAAVQACTSKTATCIFCCGPNGVQAEKGPQLRPPLPQLRPPMQMAFEC